MIVKLTVLESSDSLIQEEAYDEYYERNILFPRILKKITEKSIFEN